VVILLTGKLEYCVFYSFPGKFTSMLDVLAKRLSSAQSTREKLLILNEESSIAEFFQSHPALFSFFTHLPEESKLVLQELIVIGQANRLLEGADLTQVHDLLNKLFVIHHFYREIGGIVGYQAKVLELLEGRFETPSAAGYHSPAFIDIATENPDVQQAIAWGIDELDQIAEIYPLGGAADRLHLVEEKTGVELPAAKLPFAGRSLLEHLIRDLQAREYLYFLTHGTQITTPIAIMTSHEKNNHVHVTEIWNQGSFFGRPKDSVRFFTQPLVPAVNEKGEWCINGPLQLVLKPGGHGAIWKLARDEGILRWLEEQGRTKALVRQINNPVAGLDYGLLAFAGIGCKQEMLFGFASCPRLLQAAEGVNVLIEKEGHLVLTNIEYCDFTKFGIEDKPLKEGEPYSRFSSNTNILFADLKAIASAIDRCPFPGLLMNLKKASYLTEAGEKKEEFVGRLESTMQNIADVFTEKKGHALKTEKTFVTYNRRLKTISTAKKAFVAGRSFQETPENCFYDLLSAHRELLLDCGFTLPSKRTLEEYLIQGPEFIFLYHPALGPLYSLIKDKLRGGKLGLGSELILELASFSAKNLLLEGSLQVIAEQPLGKRDEKGILQFSKQQLGKCILENVTIENQGVDWKGSQSFWKMDLKRHETVKIILKGESQFIARNVRIQGNQTFIVEDGEEMSI
jgi:UDP-N-acetylglucosamine pyrophosphorylase